MKRIKKKHQQINQVLYFAINEHHKNVFAFCRDFHLHPVEVGSLLKLKKSPCRTNGKWRKISLDLAEILGIDINLLFPAELYHLSQTVTEIPMSRLPTGSILKIIAVQNDYEIQIAEQAIKEGLEKALRRCSPKEEMILRMSFGLGADREYTREEIGAAFYISHSRVGQIITKKLKEIRKRFPQLAKDWKDKLDLEPDC